MNKSEMTVEDFMVLAMARMEEFMHFYQKMQTKPDKPWRKTGDADHWWQEWTRFMDNGNLWGKETSQHGEQP